MAEVKVLIDGQHEHTDDNMLKISSSVTLIKSDKNIIVDTGGFEDKEKIIAGLKEENLSPDDIDIVILTHLHLDHVVNTYLFNNAKVYCKFRGDYQGQFHLPSKGALEHTNINDGIKLADDVEFMLTPGHSEDMVSVIVDTDHGKYVIAGDAIPDESFMDIKQEPKYVSDQNAFNKSREKILKIADQVVPGHGPMFKVKK